MKLLNKIGYLLITSMLFISFIGSIIFYVVMKSSTEKEIQKELLTRIDFLIPEIENNPEQFSSLKITNDLEVYAIDSTTISNPVHTDTLLFNNSENLYRQFSQLTVDRSISGNAYRITVYKSLSPSNELIERITLIFTLINIIFILLIYISNRIMFRNQWSGFLDTVNKLRSFDVNKVEDIGFDSLDIQEFSILNEALQQMTSRIYRDYNNMKEFTGNVSHEVQTPLTVIRQKSELLLQIAPLNEVQMELISDIQKNTSRLTHLVKSLALLTKIENKQFTSKEKVSVKKQVQNILENTDSIIDAKELVLQVDLQEELIILAEPMLIEVLLMNLIRNAIFYNKEKGCLKISLKNKLLTVSNESDSGDLSNKGIFSRHVSYEGKADSLGLGLALAKKISDLYVFRINYIFTEEMHHFSIDFNQPSSGL